MRGLVDLLRRMRNDSTPVVVYPRSPSSEISQRHGVLTRELQARAYRVLPEDELDPICHLNQAELAILLLDSKFDETNRRLLEEIKKLKKTFVVGPSPSIEINRELAQRGLLKEIDQMEHRSKNLLSPLDAPEKLIGEVFAILKAKIPPTPDRKPLVYLIFDRSQTSEAANAGQFVFHYRKEFHFESNSDPRRHTAYLRQSDGVLLV